MFYFAKKDLIQGQKLLQGGKKCTYVEIEAKLSLEIDSSLDLAFAEQIVLHEGLRPFHLSNFTLIESSANQGAATTVVVQEQL